MKRLPVTMDDFLIVLRAIERDRGVTLKAMTLGDVKEAQEFENLRACTRAMDIWSKNFTYAYWDKSLEI